MKDPFSKYVEDRHGEVIRWKREKGKKVFGYFCCITPEEILYAGDILPVRITGTGEALQHADAHLPPNTCPFARSCLDAGIRGIYEYLDGIVVPNSCDIVFSMEYFWKTLVRRPTRPALIAGVDIRPYVHYINYPEKIMGREVVNYYKEVLKGFKQEIERSIERTITEEDLRRAIRVYNDNKAKLRRMYDMRRSDPPAISGYDAWKIVYASLLMPKDEHSLLLEGILHEMQNNPPPLQKKVRIYLSGSAMDSINAAIYKVIEDSGGNVVSDDLCIGTRSFWYPLNAELPPLEAIARRSLGTACPRSTVTHPIPENRWAHIINTTKGFNVQGVVFYVLKCCDARLVEFAHLRDKIREELGVPVLFLEGDYTSEGIEQLKGQVEAFIEMVGG